MLISRLSGFASSSREVLLCNREEATLTRCVYLRLHSYFLPANEKARHNSDDGASSFFRSFSRLLKCRHRAVMLKTALKTGGGKRKKKYGFTERKRDDCCDRRAFLFALPRAFITAGEWTSANVHNTRAAGGTLRNSGQDATRKRTKGRKELMTAPFWRSTKRCIAPFALVASLAAANARDSVSLFLVETHYP